MFRIQVLFLSCGLITFELLQSLLQMPVREILAANTPLLIRALSGQAFNPSNIAYLVLQLMNFRFPALP